MTRESQADMDRACNLLVKLGWGRETDLERADGSMNPVFYYRLSERHPHPCLKVVVGPLWTTYYKLVGNTILNQDSVKTDDYELLESVLKQMMNARGRKNG